MKGSTNQEDCLKETSWHHYNLLQASSLCLSSEPTGTHIVNWCNLSLWRVGLTLTFKEKFELSASFQGELQQNNFHMQMWWLLSCQEKINIWHLKLNMSDRLAVLGFSCQHCWLPHTNFLVFDSHSCSSGALSKPRPVPILHLVFRLSHSTCVCLLGGSFEVEFQLAEHIWWTPGQQHTASVIPFPCCWIFIILEKQYPPKAMCTLWRPQSYPLSTFSLS